MDYFFRILLLLITPIVMENAIAQKYTADWQSLEKHKEVPDWMRDAKFGIYCHWGVYAVPAYNNEHYIQHMHNDKQDYSKLGTYKRHQALYGSLEKLGYHDFIPKFKGENFNADEWADLFVKGGARFAGPVAEHHDGFAMWDSELTPFNAKDMGPKRDVVGELEKAIRGRGLKFFTSLHHELNYTNVKLKPGWAGADPKYAKLYGSTMDKKEWDQMWMDKCKELVSKYHPDVIYHDAWLEQVPEKNIQSYLAHYFNEAEKRQQDVIVTYKGEDLPAGVGMEDHENSNPDKIIEKPWLCDYSIGTGLSYSWGYTEGMEIRTAKEIVHTLIDVVSKNGQMLLNLSPMADGTFPEEQKQVVHKVGRWMWTFGEAIYETRPYKVFGETLASGKKVYYTQKGKTIYAILLDWPVTAGEIRGTEKDIATNGNQTDIQFSLKTLSKSGIDGKVKAVNLLGLKNLVVCNSVLTDKGLNITIPGKTRIPSDIAHVIKIEME
ncbi:alpha-L-fucosidase [Dyadobacter luteus]|uniref:alpha-L-fucosidase n=1 Tax=Dyadobacter luteus TaxID=2259619 RepID=A0A3D8Y6F6_9BACT|nr:alpha-L-fucosidase [Dyadobacter luteus]REA57792.1 alpha-L-fucosidase [Dyadobacter luteus]